MAWGYMYAAMGYDYWLAMTLWLELWLELLWITGSDLLWSAALIGSYHKIVYNER